jgi:CO/xanthine dehydrogenase Mo-binding subunit
VATMKTTENTFNPIGASLPRGDVHEKVTGTALYTDDLQFGGKLLYARVKRSPYPHASIKKVDVSKAKALPGVKAVIVGADFPKKIGIYLKDKNILAIDRVRFIGEGVAAVAAISNEIAMKALELIDVEYEELEPVFDPEYGASKEAPLIHPQLGEYSTPNFIFPVPGTNIANHFKIRKGDVEGAWEQCAFIVERRFKLPQIQHVSIETHVAVAMQDEKGKITLWASSQSPFAQRNLIAETLEISPTDLRVIAPYVGGGFGAKAGVTMEAIPVALATRCKGWPVKLLLTREEEFFTNFVRQGLVSTIKAGCDRNGRLIALRNIMYFDGGGSTEYGVNVTRAAGYSSSGPYDIPNVHTDSICVYTNNPIGGAYRGFGMPEVHTGLDQVMDELAEQAGLGKVEFLKLNGVKTGDVLDTGMIMHPNGLIECIDNVAKAINWEGSKKPSSPNKYRGKGIAIAWKAPAMPPNAGSSAWVAVAEDGKVTVGLGGQEIGQGTFTAMAQIAAAALGVPYGDVRIASPIDTQYSPYEWQSVASRLTWSMGNAVRSAAADARKQILDLVAEAWKEDPEDLDIVNGKVVSFKSENETTLKNIAVYGMPKENNEGWIGGPIIGRGSFMPTYVTNLDPETGQGPRSVVHYTVGCEGLDIEIDKSTGAITVLKAAAAFDVGHAINPMLVKSQIEGGFVQGLSSAIFEEIKLKQGVTLNPSLMDYRIATTADTDFPLETPYVEVPQDDGPWGARGIGEHPMIPTIAALANAIYDATKIRFEGPPFSAEKIYLALLDHGLVK